MQQQAVTVSDDISTFPEQVRLLYLNAKTIVLTVVPIVLLLTVVLWSTVPVFLLLTWLAYTLLVTLGRWLVVKAYWRSTTQQTEATKWAIRHIIGTLCISITWVTFTLVLLPYVSVEYRLIGYLLLAGLISSAVSSLAVVLGAFVSLVLPVASALTAHLFLTGDAAAPALAGMMVVYLLILFGSANNTSRTIIQSLHLQIALQREQEKLAERDAALQQQRAERKQTEAHLHESATVLAVSTQQIMDSLTQMVENTSQTATAVTDTATTVDEVKQTAYAASRQAREISQSAQQAVHIAEDGSRAAEEAVTGLHHVRDQLRAIADSVTRLGEQSHTISEVIATVQDLAERSNLLAVNAAIEAAKAGERGKGFVVVAQEVRSLATQSKQATNQVRSLLRDIQSAGTVAVQVTDHGTQSAESGVEQAFAAGRSIHSLSEGIRVAAQTVTQIATSSQQQVTGMDNIATAIHSIKVASDQNVDGIKQIKTAAQDLYQLGQTLQNLVDQYTQRGER